MSKNIPIVLGVLLIAIMVPLHAEAWCWWRCSKQVKPQKPTPVVVVPAIPTIPTKPTTPPTIPTMPPVVPPVVVPGGGQGESTLQAWITAYTYYDNDPPGSAAISDPIIHKTAGGTGTYADPITMAVGYTSAGPDIKPGTRYYIPNLRKYFIVEDTCAACHKGYQGKVWLDLWIDGAKTTASKADACARSVTATQTVILNPLPTYPVVSGVVSAVSCATQFGTSLLSS